MASGQSDGSCANERKGCLDETTRRSLGASRSYYRIYPNHAVKR